MGFADSRKPLFCPLLHDDKPQDWIQGQDRDTGTQHDCTTVASPTKNCSCRMKWDCWEVFVKEPYLLEVTTSCLAWYLRVISLSFRATFCLIKQNLLVWIQPSLYTKHVLQYWFTHLILSKRMNVIQAQSVTEICLSLWVQILSSYNWHVYPRLHCNKDCQN